MRHFCIAANKSKDKRFEVTRKIEKYITSHGGECTLLEDLHESGEETEKDDVSVNFFDAAAIPANAECILVLGGDGTIIEASRSLAGRSIPLVGINLGHLGFLSVVDKNRIDEALDNLLNDNFKIEKRMLLSVKVVKNGRETVNNALNDVSITRNGISRMICTDVYINDELIGSYQGDGCLVATPTGSTGYNLSAGGPVIVPESELMCITPICPHTLYNRSIIVSGMDRVKIVIGSRRKTKNIEAFATVDGQMAVGLEAGDYVEVEKAEEVTGLITFPGHSYFRVLHSKLERYPSAEQTEGV